MKNFCAIWKPKLTFLVSEAVEVTSGDFSDPSISKINAPRRVLSRPPFTSVLCNDSVTFWYTSARLDPWEMIYLFVCHR